MHIHMQYVQMTDQSCMFVYMYIILAYNSNICTYARAMCGIQLWTILFSGSVHSLCACLLRVCIFTGDRVVHSLGSLMCIYYCVHAYNSHVHVNVCMQCIPVCVHSCTSPASPSLSHVHVP